MIVFVKEIISIYFEKTILMLINILQPIALDNNCVQHGVIVLHLFQEVVGDEAEEGEGTDELVESKVEISIEGEAQH